MSFLIKDKALLEKYSEILEKVRNIVIKKLITNLYIPKNI